MQQSNGRETIIIIIIIIVIIDININIIIIVVVIIIIIIIITIMMIMIMSEWVSGGAEGVPMSCFFYNSFNNFFFYKWNKKYIASTNNAK